jgi:hypothetical protein
MPITSIDPDEVKARWWQYLPCLHRILQCFAKPRNNRKRGLRLFTMVPLTAMHRRFIMIDTDGLHQICRGAGVTDLTISEFRMDAAVQWRDFFNVDMMTTATRRFGYSIQTDGVSVSVSLTRERNDADVSSFFGAN